METKDSTFPPQIKQKDRQYLYMHILQVAAVDPNGSKMALPAPINNTKETFFEVEGIGHDFVPTVCDRSVRAQDAKLHDLCFVLGKTGLFFNGGFFFSIAGGQMV